MSYPDALSLKTLLNSCFKSCVNSYSLLMKHMQPCNKISPSHQMQMEIQLHHPLQVAQKQTMTEKEIQEQDQEVCVSLFTIPADFVVDVSTDHGAVEQEIKAVLRGIECLINLVLG